jgi:biotin operon repressor
MKGETAAQRKAGAKSYFDWQEYVIDRWQPEIDPWKWSRVKVSTAKLVALAKASRTDYGRNIFRSDQYVADAIGLDRKTVRRHMKFLLAFGVLRETGRRRGRMMETAIVVPQAPSQDELIGASGTLNSGASGPVDSGASGTTNLPKNLPNESLSVPAAREPGYDPDLDLAPCICKPPWTSVNCPVHGMPTAPTPDRWKDDAGDGLARRKPKPHRHKVNI